MNRLLGYALILSFGMVGLASGAIGSDEPSSGGSSEHDAPHAKDRIQSQWLPRAGLGFVLNLQEFQTIGQSITPASTPLAPPVVPGRARAGKGTVAR